MISYFSQKVTLRYPDSGSENNHFKEDNLTSIVFDLLKYLPTNIFWDILKKSLLHNKFNELPQISGELLQIDFWDKWDSTGTSNSNFVEPDVFLRFKDFDVIIEAKYRGNKQTAEQFNNQVIAYLNEFKKSETENVKDMYFIQIDGLIDYHNKLTYLSINDNQLKYIQINDNLKNEVASKSIINHIKVCKTTWDKLLQQILFEKEEQKNVQVLRILEDLIKGLELHHYFKTVWLESLNNSKNKSINYTTPINLFNYAK